MASESGVLHCESCGNAVQCAWCMTTARVSTSSEGTASYEPVISPERLEKVRDHIERAQGRIASGDGREARRALADALVVLDALLAAPQ